MSTVFESKRLKMRAWRRQDLETFHQLWSDPQVVWWRGTWLSWAQSRELFRGLLERCEGLPEGLGWWVMEERDTGEIVGNVMLQPYGSDETELGMTVMHRKWGKGFASETVHAVLAYGFDVLGLEAIIAVIQVENEAAVHIVEKCGFELDGYVIHRSFPHHRYVRVRDPSPEAAP
jgi:RimJ/RimL family protein N-acetyltransferase